MASEMFGRLRNQFLLWSYKRAEVDRFHRIVLSDLRENAPHFKTTLRRSLQLICDYDPIRFRRVQRHIALIVNCYLPQEKAAQYEYENRLCLIDFREPVSPQTKPWHYIFYAAEYAKTLVHEATHGLLISRNVGYKPEVDFRLRVEKCCSLEENRFVRRVARRAREIADEDLILVMENLESEFKPGGYETAWKESQFERIKSAWNRLAKG